MVVKLLYAAVWFRVVTTSGHCSSMLLCAFASVGISTAAVTTTVSLWGKPLCSAYTLGLVTIDQVS